jgi:release factor glutamine methyltransferase
MTAAVLGLTCGCADDNEIAPDHFEASPPAATPGEIAEPHQDEPQIVQWGRVPELEEELVVYESVFWQPADTHSLRKLIVEDRIADNKTVLEIGTGSGLVSLCCLAGGATSVVATDINPAAIRNAEYNARRLKMAERLNCRLVPRRDPGAWSVIGRQEKFDLIVSNPPWEHGKPTRVDDFALYDPDFALLRSLVTGGSSHLNPAGRMLLAYGCVTAIRLIFELSVAAGMAARILDDRELADLPEVFLPGMLIELQPQQN